MRITVLSRGGLSVYGGTYDAKLDLVVPHVKTQQTVTIIFPDTITDAQSIGIDLSEMLVVGNTVSFIGTEFSGTVTGYMGDERPTVRIETNAIPNDAYCD